MLNMGYDYQFLEEVRVFDVCQFIEQYDSYMYLSFYWFNFYVICMDGVIFDVYVFYRFNY